MGNKRIENWMKNYILLIDYYNQFGNIDVPQSYVVDGVKLGCWMTAQRFIYNSNGSRKLSDEQIDLLNKLGMKWNLKLSQWDKNYSLLEEYYKEHGNIDVPQPYVVNGVNLGFWISRQRFVYNSDDNSKLSEEQIELLNKLGMKWDVRLSQWDKNYSLLEEYYKEHGDIDVPYSYQIDGVRLGAWVCTQRSAYKGLGTSKLSEEQIELLNKLGMKWDLRKETWEDNYLLLVDYFNTHGNINVPHSYVVNGVNLGLWLGKQKLAYNGKGCSKINDKQIELLNELGMKWHIRKNIRINWDCYYSLLKDYYLEYGNVDVPSTYTVGDIKLGKWLTNQKKAYSGVDSRNITVEQIKLLNDINVDWNKRDTKRLNSEIEIDNFKKYNEVLSKRLNSIMNDLVNEGKNNINDSEKQEEIEKIIVKRLWR